MPLGCFGLFLENLIQNILKTSLVEVNIQRYYYNVIQLFRSVKNKIKTKTMKLRF